MMSLLRRIAAFFRRDRLAADLDEEMRLHLDLRARKLAEQGVPDAAFAARRQFGNTAVIQEASAGVWGWPAWERLVQDLRIAGRGLRKTPSFTAVAIATLAVGLGINTAVYSVVNAVLVRALPYSNAASLLSLWEESGEDPFSSSGTPVGSPKPNRTTVSVANLPDYRCLPAFAAVAAYDIVPMNLTGIGSPERITGETVTSEYLSILGMTPAMGRNFTSEDQVPGAPLAVILSHDFWQRRLGADPAALGRTILLDGQLRQIVGVMPAEFRSPAQLTMAAKIEFWAPAQFRPDLLTNRGDHEVNALVRLKPGVTLQTARAQLDALNANLARAYPATNRSMRAAIAPLQEDLTRNLGDSLAALLGASALIVLIACVNVANLFLVRAIGRRREIAVRFAIGANRWRVARQFLAESFVIAAAGCFAGIGVGFALMKTLVSLAPANMPMIRTVAWDWRVFAVATGVATVTAALFGLVPAWQSSRAKPAEALHGARATTGGAQARWRAAFAIAEVALSLILLVGAGLLLKSFVTLMGIDLGFRPERVLALNIPLPASRYHGQPERFHFFERLEERVRALPGVESVAYANRLPLRGGWGSSVVVDSDSDPNARQEADFQAVSPGYFETLGIPLLRGRSLTSQDREGQAPVAVVNQAFANRYFHGADPLGRRARRGGAGWFEIVGVVNDIRRGGKTDKINPQVYLAAAQTRMYPVQLADLAVRAAGDPRPLANAIQSEVWAIDKDQPVTSVVTLEEIVTASVAQRRFQTLLLIVFAAVAAALAVIGIYGVLSYSVSRRTPELGIRIALGANSAAIHALVLRQAGIVIAAGVAAGLAGAWALTVYLESLLFQVKAHDWRAYAGAAAVLAIVAFGASLLPARRGARIDPIAALKYE